MAHGIIEVNGDMPSNLDSFVNINEGDEPQAITQSVVVNDPNAKEISLEQESAQLQSEDIWLQRKMAGNNA
jgi:hypothetical protein